MVVKEGYNLVILDESHCHAADEILCKSGEQPWAADELHLHFIMLRDGESIK